MNRPGWFRVWARSLAWLLLLLPCGLAVFRASAQEEGQQEWLVFPAPDNSLTLRVYHGKDHVFSMGISAWGPQWQWLDVASSEKAAGEILDLTVPVEVGKEAGQVVKLRQRVRKSGPQSITVDYELSADRQIPLTALVASVNFEPAFQSGNVQFLHADGTKEAVPLALAGPGEQPESKGLIFLPKGLGGISAVLQPAVPITYHNGMRVLLAQKLLKAGKTQVSLTITLPGPTRVLLTPADLNAMVKALPGPDWFPLTGSGDLGPSVIGMEGWLDKPAGMHGGVRLAGDHFEFADGSRVKFWGTNLSYALGAPEKRQGDYTAGRFAKFGINAVRLHKFTGVDWAGIGDPGDATKMVPQGLDRLDYFSGALARRGIYYGWSHTFQYDVRPGNRNRLLAYDEIKNNLGGNSYALINYAEDVQDLMIEMVVNLLKHRNPYTGKTYAEDPALCFIELQNEDDIFFFTTAGVYEKCPTYKRRLMERYAQWLQAKYGGIEALRGAWGGALEKTETIAARNIALQPNPWSFSDRFLPSQRGGVRQRLLDNAAFFHDVQNAFYAKFSQAIRGTGYLGPIIGSSWQAPSMLPHYYNLKSDWRVGGIDRHKYFGGNLDDSLLGTPGGGYLSSGLQQVVDRPFILSEWSHVYPSLYSAEGPALVAAYGMGLQGWDASYAFQSDQITKGFSDTVGNFPWGIWNADSPTQFGQYPALARMIHRGDLQEGEIIGRRRVSSKNLQEGRFDFSDTVNQQGDLKTFSGNTAAAALAAGRLVVEFADADLPSNVPDLKKWTRGKCIIASTGQLRWDHSGKGVVVIDAPGTKAVVGFANGKPQAVQGGTITLECPYASLFLTSAEKEKDLNNCQAALITVVARNCNSGFTYFVPSGQVVNNGHPPVLLEPVKATIRLERPIKTVNVLDMDGRQTQTTLPVENNGFTLDSARQKTIYYQVIFAEPPKKP
jgi:hypothetical protein